MGKFKMLTVITESVLESVLVDDIEQHGAHGYTVTDARGKGDRGLRNAEWNNNSNIRIEVLCDSVVCEEISSYLQKKYYDDYAMITFSHEIDVLRNDKF